MLLALLIISVTLFVLVPCQNAHASTPIIFDSSATNNCHGCSPLTWSHTVGSGSNGILIVGVSIFGSSPAPVTSVRFGAASLSRLGSHLAGAVNVELWSLLDPPSGAATITVTFSSTSDVLVGGSVSYFNVVSTGTVASADYGGTPGTTASVTVSSSSTGDLVVDTLGAYKNGAIAASPIGSGQTQRWNSGSQCSGSACNVGAGSDKPASSPVTMTWSVSSTSDWSLIAVPLKPTTTTTITSPVGGYVTPVNKVAILAPYVALFGIMAAVTVVMMAPWKKTQD